MLFQAWNQHARKYFEKRTNKYWPLGVFCFGLILISSTWKRIGILKSFCIWTFEEIINEIFCHSICFTCSSGYLAEFCVSNSFDHNSRRTRHAIRCSQLLKTGFLKWDTCIEIVFLIVFSQTFTISNINILFIVKRIRIFYFPVFHQSGNGKTFVITIEQLTTIEKYVSRLVWSFFVKFLFFLFKTNFIFYQMYFYNFFSGFLWRRVIIIYTIYMRTIVLVLVVVITTFGWSVFPTLLRWISYWVNCDWRLAMIFLFFFIS